MKKRCITSLVAGGLLAAMLPGAAFAQGDVEGSMTFSFALTCDVGQVSPWALPPCDLNEDSGILTVTVLSADQVNGAFDGVQVRDGAIELNTANGDFAYAARVMFSGTVEGCGAGTVYFDASGEGVNDADDIATFTSNTYTIVPGGTLPVVGSLEMSGTEIPNDDGTETMSSTGTITCDAE